MSAGLGLVAGAAAAGRKKPRKGARGLRTLCAWPLCEEEPRKKPTRILAVVQEKWIGCGANYCVAGRVEDATDDAMSRGVMVCAWSVVPCTEPGLGSTFICSPTVRS